MSKSYTPEEITPPHLRCGPGSCPAVFRLNNGNLLIIGKLAPHDIKAHIDARIGADEAAVVISAEYLRDLRFPQPD
jgi:hypothetical protein